VPAVVSVIGNLLVAAGLGVAMLVVVQNAYAAANVTIEAGQTVTTAGLYGLVRHPMYVGALIMMLGIPLALNSLWAFVFLVPVSLVLVLRIVDEEKLLERDLDGYTDYEHQVHYRLVPHLW
jgi:protein-S-isoprenylcysteine O-methyltransferase Ste14